MLVDLIILRLVDTDTILSLTGVRRGHQGRQNVPGKRTTVTDSKCKSNIKTITLKSFVELN